ALPIYIFRYKPWDPGIFATADKLILPARLPNQNPNHFATPDSEKNFQKEKYLGLRKMIQAWQ
ncbi:MAG TPA: hypothetical protein DIS76_04220, partial [Rhodospirillaceae bacterium]|nr:hypothetical protein [Rhodospirillaceae bacterium]